jgi:hypothetical protein
MLLLAYFSVYQLSVGAAVDGWPPVLLGQGSVAEFRAVYHCLPLGIMTCQTKIKYRHDHINAVTALSHRPPPPDLVALSWKAASRPPG